MVNYREILRLTSLNHSMWKISASVHSSRDTVSEVIQLAEKHGMVWPLPEDLSNEDLRSIFYPNRKSTLRKRPDCQQIHREMAKPGVNLMLLWSEYCETCCSEGSIPLQYTQFCDDYRKYARTTKATMRIKRKPGELLEVDWAGDTLTLRDELTGESITVYLFVASLPCSLYSYAEAFFDMKSESWITAHIHAYDFFGGVTRILVPDNLKTGVIKHTHDTLILNRAYQEMAEYYGTAIIPTKPISPKGKPNVEGTVGVLSTWIIAALRQRTFFTLQALNEAVVDKLMAFNHRSFQKKPGSRFLAFEEEEKEFLLPLPSKPYEMAFWSEETVSLDYLITDGQNKYSVPFEFIGHKVDKRITSKTIEVFFQGNRIASHVRAKQYLKDPVVIPEHMTEKQRKFLTYHKETFLDWAEHIGNGTTTVVKAFLSAGKVKEQGYKSCGALMNLADHYSTKRIEAACNRALT